MRALAQIFIEEGALEGVRGDMAFVQAVLETGGFFYSDNGQIRPEFNNYGGINANDGRRKGTTCADEVLDLPLKSRCFPTPQIGVRANIHLLRGYADPLVDGICTDRIRMPPSDRIGIAPIWEYFGGNSPTGKLIWASAPDYGLRIIQLYSGALVLNGARAECLPYFPGSNDQKSGSGYWIVTSDSGVYSFGTAAYYGGPGNLKLNQPLVNGEARPDGTGYWLMGQDGGIFSYGNAQFFGSMGGRPLNQPVNGLERTDQRRRVTGSSRTTAASSPSATRPSTDRWAAARSTSRCSGWNAPRPATATGCSRGTAASSPSVTRSSTARSAASASTAQIVAMQRTATGNGYWMLGSDGSMYAFGDAAYLGGVGGCANYGGARRLLVTPTGNGYWIATANGSVIPFGDARRLGFPALLFGSPVALMLNP